MISGTRSYRDHEFVYQDFLYDDRSLTYPADPKTYAGNAADIVEVRVKALSRALAVRITYNSMLDPQVAAATIALGDSPQTHQLPHAAGAVAPGQFFVTVHGCTGDIVRATDGTTLSTRPIVATDLQRRQVQVEVPYEVFDPRGKHAVRVALAAGLWDVHKNQYQRPDASLPAFFNVAFRKYGRWVANTWMDESQTAALKAADLSPLFASIDFVKLSQGRDDDLHGQAGGVPTSGPMDRILVSHFEYVQGRGSDSTGDPGNYGKCDPPACTVQFSGRLEPYGVYVPAEPAPPGGYGLVVSLHGSHGNQNFFEGGPPGPIVDTTTGVEDPARLPGETELDTWKMLAESGRPAIMILPNARGAVYQYRGEGLAEVYEDWADIAGHYRLDPGRVIQTGSSMGGWGSYKLAAEFPDLYVAMVSNVGAGNLVLPQDNPALRNPLDVTPTLASLRSVPVLAANNAEDPLVNMSASGDTLATLDQLGFRYDAWYFTGPWGLGGHAEYRNYIRDQIAALKRLGPAVRNPRRVSYGMSATLNDARYGIVPDHAYWLSGMAVRDTVANYGTLDATSFGLPGGDPVLDERRESSGANVAGYFVPPHVRLVRAWTGTMRGASGDHLAITARNASTVSVDLVRANLNCHPVMSVDTDGPLRVTLLGRGCHRVLHFDAVKSGIAGLSTSSPAKALSPSERILRNPALLGCAVVLLLGCALARRLQQRLPPVAADAPLQWA